MKGLFLLISISMAAIITVDDNGPADFSIIQDGIDVASDGDIDVLDITSLLSIILE